MSAPAQTREQGYALDSEENEQGVRCVAVPVWNHESRVIAALSLSTLTSRVDDAELANFREELRQAGPSFHARWATRPEPSGRLVGEVVEVRVTAVAADVLAVQPHKRAGEEAPPADVVVR